MTRKAEQHAGGDESYTAAAAHSTAAAIGKQYRGDFPASENPDKSPFRTDDRNLSSGDYARSSDALADKVTNELVRIDYHHKLERYLGTRPMRWLLRMLSKERPDEKFPAAWATTALERAIYSYRNPAVGTWRRLRYWLVHKFIDRMRGKTDAETFRRRLSEHVPTVRGLVIVAKSIAEFGLTVPQRLPRRCFPCGTSPTAATSPANIATRTASTTPCPTS